MHAFMGRVVLVLLTLAVAGPLHGQLRPTSIQEEVIETYWLSDSDSASAELSGPLLLITHVSLDKLGMLERLSSDLKDLGRDVQHRGYVLDAPAVFFETHKRDSIWNRDGLPIKVFEGHLASDQSGDLVANGRRYKVEVATRGEVARLLNRPAGTIPLHRRYAPVGGAEKTVRALRLLLGEKDLVPSQSEAPEKTETETERLCVMNWNVLYGFNHQKSIVQAGRWLASQEVDVAAFQELNGLTEEKLRKESEAWGHQYAATHKVSGFPVGLTSKEPIEVIERVSDGFHHGFLHCKTYGVHFFVVHFWPGKSHEVDAILGRAKPLLDNGEKVIILGDFNACSRHDEAFLVEHAKLRERDYTFVDKVEAQDFVDLVLKHDPDAKVSCPSPITIPRWSKDVAELKQKEYRIDFVFADRQLSAHSRAGTIFRDREIDLISDHYPVWVEFELPQASRSGETDD